MGNLPLGAPPRGSNWAVLAQQGLANNTTNEICTNGTGSSYLISVKLRWHGNPGYIDRGHLFGELFNIRLKLLPVAMVLFSQ